MPVEEFIFEIITGKQNYTDTNKLFHKYLARIWLHFEKKSFYTNFRDVFRLLSNIYY